VDDSRVMVFSAAAGAGHVSAANALKAAFALRGVQAEHVEVLKYTSSVFRNIYSKLYLELIEKGPTFLGWVYDATDEPWKHKKRMLALDRLNTRPLKKLIREQKPALAVCTHFLPAEILLYLRRKGDIDLPVGIVITDVDAHAMWLYQDTDWYFVSCEQTKQYLMRLGVEAGRIHVTGIPVLPEFAKQRAKLATRRKLGLDEKLTTVLVSAGGFGVGPVEALVKEVCSTEYPLQAAVICGRNEELKRKIEGMERMRNPVKAVGYTTEMYEWMAASDVMVGKAGGLTSSEALASGLVLVIVNPVPGQEERNSDYFLEKGVAIRCNDLPLLSYKLGELLSDRTRLAAMRSNVKAIARPNAAVDVVSTVLSS